MSLTLDYSSHQVKRAINSKQTYNEFLKILNLFSQEIIDNRTLIERVTPFLGEGELLVWFKRFVKYEDGIFIEKLRGLLVVGVWNRVTEKEKVDLAGCKGSGRSYRLLPVGVSHSFFSLLSLLFFSIISLFFSSLYYTLYSLLSFSSSFSLLFSSLYYTLYSLLSLILV
jgi:Paired amphipathic helix repeat